VQGQYTRFTRQKSSDRQTLLDEVQTQQLLSQGMNPIGQGQYIHSTCRKSFDPDAL